MVEDILPAEDASGDSNAAEGEFDPLACELNNRAITCPHGKLDPEETRNTRVISAVGSCLSRLLQGLILEISGWTETAERYGLRAGRRAGNQRHMQNLCYG